MLLTTVRIEQSLSSGIPREKRKWPLSNAKAEIQSSLFCINTFRKLDKGRARTRMQFNFLAVTNKLMQGALRTAQLKERVGVRTFERPWGSNFS